MHDLGSLNESRRRLLADVADLTARVAETKKKIKRSATYAEELNLRVALCKMEYDLSIRQGEFFEVLGEIARAERGPVVQ